jgi:cytochrome c556
MMSANQWSLVLVLGLAGAAGVWTVQAQDEEAGPYDNEIQYRQALMKSMGGHVAASYALLTGKITAEGQLRNHAAAIAGVVSDDVTKYFPKDSTDEDSAAEPEIWKSWETFEKRAHENHDAAVAYNKVVQSGASNADALAAFKKLTETCKNCHEDYRHKD